MRSSFDCGIAINIYRGTSVSLVQLSLVINEGTAPQQVRTRTRSHTASPWQRQVLRSAILLMPLFASK